MKLKKEALLTANIILVGFAGVMYLLSILILGKESFSGDGKFKVEVLFYFLISPFALWIIAIIVGLVYSNIKLEE